MRMVRRLKEHLLKRVASAVALSKECEREVDLV